MLTARRGPTARASPWLARCVKPARPRARARPSATTATRASARTRAPRAAAVAPRARTGRGGFDRVLELHLRGSIRRARGRVRELHRGLLFERAGLGDVLELRRRDSTARASPWLARCVKPARPRARARPSATTATRASARTRAPRAAAAAPRAHRRGGFDRVLELHRRDVFGERGRARARTASRATIRASRAQRAASSAPRKSARPHVFGGLGLVLAVPQGRVHVTRRQLQSKPEGVKTENDFATLKTLELEKDGMVHC